MTWVPASECSTCVNVIPALTVPHSYHGGDSDDAYDCYYTSDGGDVIDPGMSSHPDCPAKVGGPDAAVCAMTKC